MTDRKQEKRHRADELGGQDHTTVGISEASPQTSSVDNAEAVRRARFLAILDKVLADHYDSLAALAK